MVFLCKLNTSIRVDAKRIGIPNWQLIELHEEYHRINGKQNPMDIRELLGVVC